jgi:hypothetical protein
MTGLHANSVLILTFPLIYLWVDPNAYQKTPYVRWLLSSLFTPLLGPAR